MFDCTNLGCDPWCLHRNRRYCRRRRRYDQTVVPSHLPTRCGTLPSRLQVRHARRQAASTVKTKRSAQRYFSAVLTGLYPHYFFQFIFLLHFFVPPETSSLCRGTRRNSMDTFQRFKNNSFADCNYSISFECIYCCVYMSKWNDKIACDFRLVFINIFFLL